MTTVQPRSREQAPDLLCAILVLDPASDDRQPARSDGRGVRTGARRDARPRRRVRRLVRRPAPRPTRRDDRQPRELHALHAAAPGGRVRHARAAPRRRAAADDVPARRAAPRPADGARRERAGPRPSRPTPAPSKSATSRPCSLSAPSRASCRSPVSPSTRSASRTSRTRSISETTSSVGSRPRWRPATATSAEARADVRVRRARATRASRRSPSSSDLVRDALRHYPELPRHRTRWVLVDAAPKILPEIPTRLGDYAAKQLARRGVEIRRRRRSSRSTAERGDALRRRSASRRSTLVWTAGVSAEPAPRATWACRSTSAAAVQVDATLRVEGHDSALGARRLRARAERGDTRASRIPRPPSTRCGRRAASPGTSSGEPPPYRYRTLGQVATLGRYKGVALVFGLPLRGFLGWFVTRTYHLYQLPLVSRKLRVVTDWTVALFFRRDIAELGMLGHPTGPAAMSERERASPCLRSIDGRSQPGRSVPFRFGTAYLRRELPRVWSRNYLVAEPDLDEATSSSLAAEAERILGEAGLAPPKGRGAATKRLARGSARRSRRSAGDVDCDVVMVASAGARSRSWSISSCEEVGTEELEPVWAEAHRSEAVRQARMRSGQLADATSGCSHGRPRHAVLRRPRRRRDRGYCDLYSRRQHGQIEAVLTLERFRNRGLARAIGLARPRSIAAGRATT